MRKAMQGAWGSYIVPYGRKLEVDHSHPLTRGMTVCIIPGSQYRLNDMLGRAPPLVSSTNGPLISSRAGVGIASNVNSPAGAQSAAQSLAYLVPAGGMTLGYLGSATATSSGQAAGQTLLGIDNSTTSRVGIKAAVGVGSAWAVQWKNGGLNASQTLTGTPYGAPNVAACACSFAWGGGTGGWATATPSGALNTGTYTTTGTPTMGTDVLCLGSGTVNGFPSLITSLAGVIWNRVLSADELQMFALAPLDFVKVVPIRTYHYSSPNVNVSVTGVAGSGASGTLRASIGGNITGVGGTSGVGSLSTRSDASPSLTGIASTPATGTLTITATASPALTGIASAPAVGTFTLEISPNIDIIGVESVADVGDALSAVGAIIDGVEAVADAGDLTAVITHDQPIIGVEALADVGAVYAELPIPITGVEADFGIGTLLPWVQKVPTGVAMTGALGTLLPATDTVIQIFIGAGATARVGPVLASIGPNRTNIALTGISATPAAGDMVDFVVEAFLEGITMYGGIGDLLPIVQIDGLGMTQLDCDATTISDNLLVNLRWSDDGGASWSGSATRELGATGEYLTSLQWRRLGMARNRIYEISWSAPVPTVLTGASVQFEVSGS